jgi:transcriptional regulator with XRE-family HTH domain
MEEAQRRDAGARLKRLRKRKGLSAERLAHEAGVSSKTVSRLEKGETEDPHDETLQKLAQALNVTREEVWPRDEPERSNGPIERLERIERMVGALVNELLSPDAAADLERELDEALAQDATTSADNGAAADKKRRPAQAR